MTENPIIRGIRIRFLKLLNLQSLISKECLFRIVGRFD